ncbi:hypothetical protein LTR35_016246 [Friedmanniomyces endolithicus]|nr:hypothetical protein LTR35_016246 [Friedmanniomyces endolithicus]
MEADKDNANPTIINSSDLPSRRRSAPTAKRAGLFDALAPAYPSLVDASSSPEPSSSEASSSSDEETEEIDEQEVYDLISTISDPEHPLSLGSLGVVKLEDIAILPPTSPRSRISTVTVLVTPTTSACSLTTVIGLGVKVRLVNALPPRFRIDVRIKPGTSGTAGEVNKQLGDKERVAAAMENKSLLNVVNNMLATSLLPGYHQGVCNGCSHRPSGMHKPPVSELLPNAIKHRASLDFIQEWFNSTMPEARHCMDVPNPTTKC